MKRVIRPGPFQYAYMLLLPAGAVALGAATILYGFSINEHDWGNRAFWGLFVAALGLIPAAYVFGMWIEVDGERLRKVYLFGLLKEQIPIPQLATDIEGRTGDEPRALFMNVEGPGAFGMYVGWIWRQRDVADLGSLATRSWNPDALMHRQNRRLIVTVELIGLLAFCVLLVLAWRSSRSG